MGKKNEGKLSNISTAIFKKITRARAKERINEEFGKYIKKQEKMTGEIFSKEDKKELRREFFKTRGKRIIEEEAKKAKGRAKILAFAAVMGIGGVKSYQLGAKNNKILGITEGEKTIEINMSEVEKDIEIENVGNQNKEDKHQVFVKELQESALNGNVEEKNKMEEQITQEIQALKTREETLEYTKQIYVDKYNSTHEEKITTENVRLGKEKENKVFYEDKAQNGDTILRQCSEYEAKEMGIHLDGNLSEISVSITKDQEKIEEKVAFHNDKFMTLFDKDEEVLENKETILCELGDVVLKGINKAYSIENKDNSPEVIEKYNEKFTKAVIDYMNNSNQKSYNNNNKEQDDISK